MFAIYRPSEAKEKGESLCKGTLNRLKWDLITP